MPIDINAPKDASPLILVSRDHDIDRPLANPDSHVSSHAFGLPSSVNINDVTTEHCFPAHEHTVL